MEENAVEALGGDPNAGRESTAETAVENSADTPHNDNRTVCVGTRDLDREVARAVQQSGTLTLQGDISVGNSINRTNNVNNYKPHYGDVHQHVTNIYNVHTEHFNRGDTRSNKRDDGSDVREGDGSHVREGDDSDVSEGDDSDVSEGDDSHVREGDDSHVSEGDDSHVSEGDDSHASEGDGSHVREGGAVTTRQRKPKKKTPPRKQRKARVPYNYKLAQNRTKPAPEREVTPPRKAFPWMTGATVVCLVAVCGLVCAVLWLLPGTPNITEYAKTDSRDQHHEERTKTSLPTVSRKTTTSKQDNGQSKTDMDDEQGSKTTTTSPLHDACLSGNLGDIDQLLHAGTADINTKTRSGRTCLHIACEGGRLDIVDYLVRHNASINARNKLGRTPLHEASRNGHADIVRKLCQHGADVNAVDTEGKTPLTEASAHGHSVIVTILTDHGADVNMRSIFDLFASNALENTRPNIPQMPEIKLPLMSAVEFGHDDIVAHLLEKQAQVNVPNKQGWMEIHMAAFNGNLSIVEKLVDKGADVHAVTERGATPLILASQEGHAKVVSFLNKRGADANHTQADGATAMMLAAENGREEVVRVLRDHWAAFTATLNGKHTTAAYLALKEGHRQIAEIFMTYNFSKEEGEMLLLLASFKGDVDMVKFLIKVLKVDVNVVDHMYKTGATPLSLAVMQGHTKVVEILLENGADVYHSVNTFTSPLINAIRTNKTEIVDLLLKYGSCKLLNSGYGPDEITPLEIALFYGTVTTFKTLLRHGANPAIHTLEFRKRNNARHIIFYTLENTTAFIKTEYLKALLDHRVSPDQRLNEGLHMTPLSIAIVNNGTENVKLLLEYGARTDAPVDALTPLYVAVYLVLPHIVEILLKHGANIEQVDSACKLTPLGVAARTGHDEVAQVLLKHNASVNVMSDEGTPLYLAAKFGHEAVARLLIKHNANVELRENKLNSTPLAVASEQGHVEIVKLLLSHGANPNATVVIFMNNTQVPDLIKKFSHSLKKTTADIEYYMHEYENSERSKDHIFLQTTPLIQAVVNNHTHVVNVLLSYGADTETRLRELTSECTPLCCASSKGYVEIIRALLQHGADVNAKGYEGQTALHVAASPLRPSSVSIIDLLLEYGADMSIKNDNGVSARVLVEQARNTIFIEGDLNWFI